MLGLLHLFHCPLLILFPFFIKTHDIFYINYFFIIMISYTFINAECPISYISKLTIDKTYVAGNDIRYYPEMEHFFNKKQVDYYFKTTTFLYMIVLFYVIFRANKNYLFFTLMILGIYFLMIHSKYFVFFQEITKYVLIFTIFYLNA